MKRATLCEMAFVVLTGTAMLSRAAQPATAPKAPAPSEAKPSASNDSGEAKPVVGAPHPMICEILYDVPKGEEGDADQNGTRSATGDEFIEIYNPHKVAIDLKGYVLSDATPLSGPESDSAKDAKPAPGKKGKPGADAAPAPAAKSDKNAKSGKNKSHLRFEFPALTLQPGEVAVVFNGFESRPAGPVGDQAASASHNDKFANAYVFSMGTKSKFAALANEGDCVTLWAPDGRAVQCVRWGTAEQSKKIDSAIVMMDAPESKGSVTLDVATGKFIEHPAVESEHGQRFFSPGVFGDSASNSKHGDASHKAAAPKAPASKSKAPKPTGDPK